MAIHPTSSLISRSSLSHRSVLLHRAALLVLGATLAVGCGGVTPEEEEYLAANDNIENAVPQAAPEQEGTFLDDLQEAEDDVSAEEACCYVRCVDGAGNQRRGPFRRVAYGNCTNYGNYYCRQHHWPFYSAGFANC